MHVVDFIAGCRTNSGKATFLVGQPVYQCWMTQPYASRVINIPVSLQWYPKDWQCEVDVDTADDYNENDGICIKQ